MAASFMRGILARGRPAPPTCAVSGRLERSLAGAPSEDGPAFHLVQPAPDPVGIALGQRVLQALVPHRAARSRTPSPRPRARASRRAARSRPGRRTRSRPGRGTPRAATKAPTRHPPHPVIRQNGGLGIRGRPGETENATIQSVSGGLRPTGPPRGSASTRRIRPSTPRTRTRVPGVDRHRPAPTPPQRALHEHRAVGRQAPAGLAHQADQPSLGRTGSGRGTGSRP